MTDQFKALVLHPVGPGRYRVENEGDPAVWTTLFGGQILAQTVTAAARESVGKHVRTVHTVFARAGLVTEVTEIRVEPVHSGRSLGSVSVGVWQGERQCAQALVLLAAPEPDHIAHTTTAPDLGVPGDARPLDRLWLVPPGGELRLVGSSDPWSPAQPSAPASLSVWYRHQGASDDVTQNQALLAWATDGFLIATAMLPHAEFRALPHPARTAVVSHTLTFHRPFTVRDWMLLVHESPAAGAGIGFGRCQVFSDGNLVASYAQDSIIHAGSPS
jgi:acyl-CoA thioesterase-2